MLRNYLKIAWRNLIRRKFYALLNIAGLAVGITFALLIGAYVWGEFQVNRQLRNADRQYLVQSRWTEKSQGMDITTFAPLGPALKAAYPTLVANVYRFYGVSATVSKNDNHFRESIQIGDSTLLTQYGFRMVQGNPRTALTGPNSVVITAEKALKFFGTTDVLNQSLRIETTGAGKQDFTVTGVLQPLTDNSVSHLLTDPNEIFLPVSSARYFGGEANVFSWQNPYIVTYLELQPGTTPNDLTGPIARLIALNTPAETARNVTGYVTPLLDHYQQSNNGLVQRMITTLTAVALFILLMAIVNFINVAMSSSSSRLREIGVRKALGGLRRQLTVQFLSEAFVQTVVATVLSVALYALFRPLFGEVVGKPVPSLTNLPGQAGGLLLILTLIVGGLAGAYPALHLSAYSSVDSLRGREKTVQEGRLFRRALVTIQFTLAVFVFVGAVFVSRQTTYFFTTDLGFKKEAVLTVSSLPRTWSKEGVARMEVARDQFARLPGVESVSLSYEIPNGNVGNGGSLVYRQGRDSTQAISAATMTTDERYARTYGIPLLGGQYFHDGQGGYDSTTLVLNEAAAKALGYQTPEAAVGQSVRFQGIPRSFRVRGVVRNFHTGTFHNAIRPLVMGQVRVASIYRFFSFRLALTNTTSTIAGIEQKWHELFPDAPFDYAFMDQTLEKLYRTELQLEKAAYVATALALLIVLLGIIGLVSLSVARRTKEVGIRKVLGASVPGIVGLFLNEYVWVMVIANAVAWPLAYMVISDWLADYAYHVQIGWQPFVQVGLSLAGLTGIVVGLQVLKAALANPVKSIRTE